MVAMAILVVAVLTMLGLRTGALIDAAEARNWRTARELAETKLSELRAGAHERMPDSGREIRFDDEPDFWAVVLIGEAAIADHESQMADRMAYQQDRNAAQQGSRMQWQQEREALRRAQRQGVSFREYQDQQTQERLNGDIDDRPASEDEMEDVAVIVYFPKIDYDEDTGEEHDSYVLKAKVSTLAIRGFTPEKAERWNEANAPAGAANPLSGNDE